MADTNIEKQVEKAVPGQGLLAKFFLKREEERFIGTCEQSIIDLGGVDNVEVRRGDEPLLDPFGLFRGLERVVVEREK